jgi:hypothetical protein
VYSTLIVIFPVVMVTMKIIVMSRVRLWSKSRLNTQNQEPYQVLDPKLAHLSRPAHPSSEGAMSGLANVKRKLAEIDKERKKIIFSQQKIKDDVIEMIHSLK